MSGDTLTLIFGTSGTVGSIASLTLLSLTLYRLVYHAGPKQHRRGLESRFSTALLLNLSVANLFAALYFAFVFASEERVYHNSSCQYSGFVRTVSESAAVLWTCAITFSTWFLARSRDRATPNRISHRSKLRLMLTVFCFLCWGLPLVVGIALLVSNQFTPERWWCFLPANALRLGLFFSLLCAALIFNVVMFVLMLSSKNLAKVRHTAASLFWYIPGFCYVWLPTISISFVAIAGHSIPDWLNGIRGFTEPQQGLVNLLIWFFFTYRRQGIEHPIDVPTSDDDDDEGYLSPSDQSGWAEGDPLLR